eukprot:CAMPEP_0170448326 /NCGR_PEP_ID=MMETSP0117_2-20130122/50647_1 /TAXON_ID=400756 /ORGANISM="Durinskia baltica, Strain CSIRO CS-38" /LENGTH=38 /DNA_ID= /DNA_START= /DNA_END= /DNA_ORIENTATION=
MCGAPELGPASVRGCPRTSGLARGPGGCGASHTKIESP